MLLNKLCLIVRSAKKNFFGWKFGWFVFCNTIFVNMLKAIFVFCSTLIFLSSTSQTLSGEDSTSKKVKEAVIYTNGQPKVDTSISYRPTTKVKKQGKLHIVENDSIGLLIAGYKEQKKLMGYKIQLYSGRSRMEAVKVKSSFHNKYGESENVDIVYQQPNFKIRVGNYRDRLIAHKWLAVYKIDFPSSFIVQDEIELVFE